VASATVKFFRTTFSLAPHRALDLPINVHKYLTSRAATIGPNSLPLPPTSDRQLRALGR
jgi:hypothetical protein